MAGLPLTNTGDRLKIAIKVGGEAARKQFPFNSHEKTIARQFW